MELAKDYFIYRKDDPGFDSFCHTFLCFAHNELVTCRPGYGVRKDVADFDDNKLCKQGNTEFMCYRCFERATVVSLKGVLEYVED
jgi:hypothetical protein